MSRDYLVPVGHLPMFDALDRARLEFPTETKARFIGLLRSGNLQAWCSDQDGNVKQIEPAFWTSKDAARALEENEVRTGPLYSGRSEGRPVFLGADLDKHLPSFEQRLKQSADERLTSKVAAASPRQSVLDKGGGKQLYDEVGFLIEAFKIVYEGKPPPNSQADLSRKALDAYQQRGLKGGTPSPEWPKVIIRRLWKELGLERTAVPPKQRR